MSKVMGAYCKAYHLNEMRKYAKWTENLENTRTEEKEPKEIRILTDDSIVYLQENFVVTIDIYKEENILFDNVTPEWKEYCKKELNFEIPKI